MVEILSLNTIPILQAHINLTIIQLMQTVIRVNQVMLSQVKSLFIIYFGLQLLNIYFTYHAFEVKIPTPQETPALQDMLRR